jgi:hypothetical protein
MKIPFRLAGIAVTGAALLLGVSGPAGAKPSTSSNWHVGTYNASGKTLSFSQAQSSPGNLAAFNFTSGPDIASLTTSQGSQSGLLGNIAGKTVSATFTITGSGPFTYFGEPDGSGAPATVRLYFETTKAGGFSETNYWWSNPAHCDLATGSCTVTTSVVGTNWSDYNGHFGTDTNSDGFQGAAGFANAAGNATDIGLSFGGGYFFENGVGAPNGATFTLNSFTVS